MSNKTRLWDEKKKKLREETKVTLRHFCADNKEITTLANIYENGLWQQIFFHFYGEYPKGTGPAAPAPSAPGVLTPSREPPGSCDPRWDDLLIGRQAVKLLREVLTATESEVKSDPIAKKVEAPK